MTPDPAPPPAGPDPDALALAILADADRLYAASERYAGGREAFWEVEALAARVALLRLRADRDRLADALRPFAEYADALRPDVRDDWAVARRQSVGPQPEITVRDCRRAAAALKESP